MSSDVPSPGEELGWHARTVEELFETYDTGESGLSDQAASRRLDEYGPNEIRQGERISPVRILASQFHDVLIYVLVFAALLSLGVGLLPGQEPNYVDAVLILIILLGNGLFGFVQDYRAEQAMERLRDLATPQAAVVRDGEKRTVEANSLVPGDLIIIEEGAAIPADARLIESVNLETMEAPLTGESGSVRKSTNPVEADRPLAERTNMVYMNTTAVTGRGMAVVVDTGMETEVGGIASRIQSVEESPTPFQEEVDTLGRRIGVGVIALIAVVTTVQFAVTDAGTVVILLTAITLAVAAVPEGLPAVVTLTLALGSRKMVAKNALVRRLPVVESLGSVDLILTDKTGTLTENQMTVRRMAVGDRTFDVSGSGLSTEGEFREDGAPVDPDPLEPILRCGASCNNAELPRTPDHDAYGDPTEVALLVAAKKAGVEAPESRVREVPFSSERKRMTVLIEADGAHTAYMKGAPETVLNRCDRILVDGEERPLTEKWRTVVMETNRSFAEDALRVIAFATKTVDTPDGPEGDLEENLVFLGLQGMIDPPRDNVEAAIADCRSAGIRVVMVTGDNLETAKAIGSEIGFDPTGAMTGRDLDGCTDEELREVISNVDVFARMSPEQKVRVLEGLKSAGHTVAMTGDGVNDAPGVRSADVGIAMGQRGTDVTKEASDMVLQDDNFVTIRDAIAEGRGIFDNIRKFVNYLLSANAGEVLVVFVGVILASALYPSLFASHPEALILTPVMLLWINLVTDGLPALALGTDPKAEGIMQRPPRPAGTPVIDRRMMVSIGSIGALMTLTGLALFFYGLETTRQLVVAQTLVFTFLVAVEVVRIQLIRSRYSLSPFSNRWLVGAVASSLALQAAVLYTPLNEFFDVVPVDTRMLLWIVVAFAAFSAIGAAMERVVARRFQK